MVAATAAVRVTRITAVAIAEVGAAAIGAVVITHPDPTTTWRLRPTATMGRSRTTGRTTGRATTTVRLRHLASASSSGANRGRSLYGTRHGQVAPFATGGLSSLN